MKIGFLSGFIFLLFGVYSCSQAESKELLGKWKLIDIDYSRHLAIIDPELRPSFISMTDAQSEIILNKTFFAFRPKGDISIFSPKYQGGETEIRGTFRISDEKDSVYIKNEDSESFAFQLKDENTLVLESGEAPLRVLTLIRN